MDEPVVFACACPTCREIILVAPADIHKPVAPRCHCRARETVDAVFGPRAWDHCRDPRLLRDCLAILCVRCSPRTLRLLCAALGSLVYDWCKNYWFREAVAAGEEWADGASRLRNINEIRDGLRHYGW